MAGSATGSTGEEGKVGCGVDSLPTVAVSMKRKKIKIKYSCRWAACQLRNSPKYVLAPSRSLSFFPLPFDTFSKFGNLVICNLLSFFRNLSGRCMLNATHAKLLNRSEEQNNVINNWPTFWIAPALHPSPLPLNGTQRNLPDTRKKKYAQLVLCLAI